MKIPRDLADHEVPARFFYTQFETVPLRDRRFPSTMTDNVMMVQNLRKVPQEYLDRQTKKIHDDMMKKQISMVAQFRDAEFLRPRATVFDAKGNFERTRVDEQSFI